jgi:hypothetical protein
LNTRNHNSLHAPTADKVCEAVDRWASLHKGQGNERNQLDSGPRFDGQIIKLGQRASEVQWSGQINTVNMADVVNGERKQGRQLI